MIKKLRVTVDGHTYDVTVELPDDATAITAPVAAAQPAPVPPPLPASTTAVAPAPPPSTSAPAAAAPAGAGDVPSPLAGRVIAINVTVGQEVKEGDHLLTLEAMKMNTFVMAPKSGKVAEVKTTVGSAVEEGQALITIA